MLKESLKTVLPASFRRQYSILKKRSLRLKTGWGKIRRGVFPIAQPKHKDGKVYVHLGCGRVNHPSFINIDALPAPHIHYLRPIDDLSIFTDNTVDLIYASHCLEHFSYLEIPRVLREWHRVLRREGILRISVPDFDLLLKIYQRTGNEMGSILAVLMGNQDYKYNFHMTVFNQRSLAKALSSAGFGNARPWQPGSSDLTTFDDFSDYKLQINGDRFPISLNLEATKPCEL